MKNLLRHARQFLVNEDGPTAVEYAVMLALIIVVCLTAIQAIGTNANATFNSVADEAARRRRVVSADGDGLESHADERLRPSQLATHGPVSHDVVSRADPDCWELSRLVCSA